MPLIHINAPEVEPVTVSEVMDAFRGDDEAAFTAQATMVIKALRRMAEAMTGRALITQTMELVLDDFPRGEIDLLLPNVQSIASVKYLDINDDEQQLSSNKYVLDNVGTPCRLFSVMNTAWPDTVAMVNAVRVRFVVGFGAAGSDVPEDIRIWIIAHAVQILNNPDGMVDQTFRPLPFIDRLLDQYVVYRVF